LSFHILRKPSPRMVLRPAPCRVRPLLAALPPAARSAKTSGFGRAPLCRREKRLLEERKAAFVSVFNGAIAAAAADDAGATSPSLPSEETAELRLEALGLSQASARRLVRRAAALRKRFRAAGGNGSGSSDDSDGGGASETGGKEGNRAATAADVDSAARALLEIGFRISEVGPALERAPGLLNVGAGGIKRRAASFSAFSSSSEEAPSAAASAPAASEAAPPPSPSPTLHRSTLVRILRHRPAALCARSAERGLRASLAALRSLGATPRSLSRLARKDPAAFWRRPGDFAAAARALSSTGCRAEAVPRLLCENPERLLGGGAAAAAAVAEAGAWLRSAPLSLSAEQAAAALRAEPALAARTHDELAAVAAALASAGVPAADLGPLVAAWPRVLLKGARAVGVKARLATEVLGAAPAALARSPRLLFDRSVSGSIGPRFAFFRAKKGRGGGEESDGEEGEGFGGEGGAVEEEAFGEGPEEEGEGGRARTRKGPSSSSSSSSPPPSSLSPSTLLRGGDTDFCLAVGGYYSLPATVEEFSIFKKRWEAEAERAAVAEGIAEERKRVARREQRQRRRSRRQQRAAEEALEAEGEGGDGREESAAAQAAAAVAAAAVEERRRQQQQQKQRQEQKQRPPQKPEAAGAALEAIVMLRTKKKGGGGGGQK